MWQIFAHVIFYLSTYATDFKKGGYYATGEQGQISTRSARCCSQFVGGRTARSQLKDGGVIIIGHSSIVV